MKKTKKNSDDENVISMKKGDEELRFDSYTLKSGEVVGSLRVFYQDKSGEWKPGRQGLTLRREEFVKFVRCLKELYAQLPSPEDDE